METPKTGYSNIIRIRAHHLLCMQGFQGHGYSREFERKMDEVINYLKSHPHCRLKVVADVDIICQHCPHQKDGRCNKSSHSNFFIINMDLMVLKKLDIKDGWEEPAQNLFLQVNEAFKDQDDLKDICGDCSWRDKCTWFLFKDIPIDNHY